MNLRNPLKGDQWNPLSYIYDLYYSKDIFLKERACIMLKDLVENLKQNIKSEKDKFWENSAGNVILGITQALLELGKKDSFTFSNIIYNLNCLDNAELRKDFRKIDSNIDYINNINSSVLIHQPLGGFNGVMQASDVEIISKEMCRTKDRIYGLISQFTGKSMTEVEHDCDRDYTLYAQEAIDYGIVDSVLQTHKIYKNHQ